MVSAASLSDEDIKIIKAMLRTRPKLSYQAILSYFTWPGRDVNHRVIGEIANGVRGRAAPPAALAEPLAHMASVEKIMRSRARSRAGSSTSPAVAATSSAGFNFLLNWWPVGQGLFSSGAITRASGTPLTWVYDCGTTSSDSILVKALHQFDLQQRKIGASSIRLAVLSHFDKDHISGFVRLINRHPIQTILLPYIPLWRRLLIAIDQGVAANDTRLEFYIDPVAYLSGIEGSKIGEFVFVSPAGPDDTAPVSPDEPEIDPDRLTEDDLKIEAKESQGGDADPGDPIGETNPRVRFLRKKGRIYVPRKWEFVPYNDGELAPKATSAFLTDATSTMNSLRTTPKSRSKDLKKLKLLYRQHFGKSSINQNLISLFLYSGPIAAQKAVCYFSSSHAFVSGSPTQRFSQMHTGDGTLDSGRRYNEFARFFTPEGRLAKSGIFQVMHHGAKNNAHVGLAKKLRPEISLFSSDPSHKKYAHPDAEVLRDFWPFKPAQIDRKDGFHFVGRMSWASA